MGEYLPLIIVGAIIGGFSLALGVAWLALRKSLEGTGDSRRIADREIIRRLLRYALPYKKEFILIFLILVVSVTYDVVSPLVVSRIQELVKGRFQLPQLWRMVGLYACLLLVSMACTYVQAVILQRVGQKILSQIRLDVFCRAQSLSHQQLSQIPVGRLVTRVTNDPNAISMLFTNVLVTLVKNTMVVLGVLGAMLVMNYALTLMVLAFVPFLIFFTLAFRKFSRQVHRNVTNCRTDVNTFLSENLSGMKITQIFNREDRKMEEFRGKSRSLTRAKLGQMFVFGIFRPMVYMLFVSSNLFLFYLGCKGSIRDTAFLGQVITSSTVVAFYMYIEKFFNPIQALAEQFDTLQRSFASAEKIFAILDMAPEVTDAPDAIELEQVRGEIEFRDVWFAYKPGEWVLKGVSFHVLPRQSVAFVGATGSGKTTILSLICRNYDIQKGQILIDGIDIRRIRIASLRRCFGQMLQDVFLFSGDIRSNLLLGMEGVPDEEIWQACRYVNADGFLSRLEGGLDEGVRERGNNFSAGQRQLLSFARTILHRPSVMILDEATANIDTETEVLIQDSLEKLKNIGTMLIVAHRLSTIQYCDNIILLSEGEIREQGTHQELLRQKGRYYQLYTLQYRKEQLTRSTR